MMSRRVRAVTSTRIFARLLGDGRQALVYQMHLDADADVAMVLPVPILSYRHRDGRPADPGPDHGEPRAVPS